MKKIFKTIAAIICFASIILAGAENLDGSCSVPWTLGWMLSAVVWGVIFKKMERQQ